MNAIHETIYPTNTFQYKIFYRFIVEPAINSTTVECQAVYSDNSWVIKSDAAINWTINSSRPGDAHMRLFIKPLLVQIWAVTYLAPSHLNQCCFIVKCALETNFSENLILIHTSHWRKWIWKSCRQNFDHFVSASICCTLSPSTISGIHVIRHECIYISL